MHRVKDTFLDTLTKVVPLAGMTVLEIGCGVGYYSDQIARQCRVLTAVDPDNQKLEIARCLDLANTKFLPASAEATGLMPRHFDVTIFTNSLHHVPKRLMPKALTEAVRVTKPGGRIVVLEPGTNGSYFEAELRFGACDGDERAAKRAAQEALYEHPKLRLLTGLGDETAFVVEDAEDFKRSLAPNDGRRMRNLDKLDAFLSACNNTLTAQRHIYIYGIRA